jgi:hypothetical protein
MLNEPSGKMNPGSPGVNTTAPSGQRPTNRAGFQREVPASKRHMASLPGVTSQSTSRYQVASRDRSDARCFSAWLAPLTVARDLFDLGPIGARQETFRGKFAVSSVFLLSFAGGKLASQSTRYVKTNRADQMLTACGNRLRWRIVIVENMRDTSRAELVALMIVTIRRENLAGCRRCGKLAWQPGIGE